MHENWYEYESISPLELTGLCILYRLIIFEKKKY